MKLCDRLVGGRVQPRQDGVLGANQDEVIADITRKRRILPERDVPGVDRRCHYSAGGGDQHALAEWCERPDPRTEIGRRLGLRPLKVPPRVDHAST